MAKATAILFKGVKTSIEFGLLRQAQWLALLLETVPELRNQRETLRRGELNNFVNRRYCHLVRVREDRRA